MSCIFGIHNNKKWNEKTSVRHEMHSHIGTNTQPMLMCLCERYRIVFALKFFQSHNYYTLGLCVPASLDISSHCQYFFLSIGSHDKCHIVRCYSIPAKHSFPTNLIAKATTRQGNVDIVYVWQHVACMLPTKYTYTHHALIRTRNRIDFSGWCMTKGISGNPMYT